jgi:hypothetical protein
MREDGNASDAAFSALVTRHGPMVLGACRRMLGDEHLAADAYQAVFLILARKARSVRVDSSYPTIFVLDAQGNIRHKKMPGSYLDKYVDELLAELEATPSNPGIKKASAKRSR